MNVVKIRDYQPKAVAGYGVRHDEPAMVIILPVVRIERNPDQPSDGLDGGSSAAPGRRRRRRRLAGPIPSLLTIKQKMEALRAMRAAERGD